jgi:hypothetical protein
LFGKLSKEDELNKKDKSKLFARIEKVGIAEKILDREKLNIGFEEDG